MTEGKSNNSTDKLFECFVFRYSTGLRLDKMWAEYSLIFIVKGYSGSYWCIILLIGCTF
ncbi:hypothetical protein BDD30_0445 [Photorhabdus asymbiotica]|uniref:Uncharacterized protein n=1 Tax=Photorhabdus asymbiotica TaxID=291112 RepID=A0ABX9SRS6_9GAMM|nr:hypothetical protein BDD30_0445 [Photorhabdus asymbiotica]